MSIVPLTFRNPHSLSHTSPAWSRCSFTRFSRICCLYGCHILDDFLSTCLCGLCKQPWILSPHEVKQFCKFLCHCLTPRFIDLCRYCVCTRGHADRWWITFVALVTVGTLSSSTLQSVCGNLLLALSLIVDEWLSTLKKFGSPLQDSIIICQK